jgi:hypothetical protein
MSDEGFRGPWSCFGADRARAFEKEAKAQVAPGHELFGLRLRAVVKCEGCDDVVFQASDDTFATVHLTWARKPDAPLAPDSTSRRFQRRGVGDGPTRALTAGLPLDGTALVWPMSEHLIMAGRSAFGPRPRAGQTRSPAS